MGVGISVFLLAVGAVLAFAVHVTVSGIDIVTVGWILMAAGALGVALDLAVFAPRRRRRISESVTYDDGPAGTVPPAHRVVHRDIDSTY